MQACSRRRRSRVHVRRRAAMAPRDSCLRPAAAGGWRTAAPAADPPAPTPAGTRHAVRERQRVSRGVLARAKAPGFLTDDLIALGVPAITRDDRLRAFERLRVPRGRHPQLRHRDPARSGRRRHAVMVGSFELQGDGLTVRRAAIRLDTGRMSPEIVERGADDILRRSMRASPAARCPSPPSPAEQMERATRRSRPSSSTSRG